MNLLNPGWLWGLIALAIPIIVHLFNFRKTRKIYFSNTQFIKRVQEASKSRRKLKHYLVLVSRMLFIFWLIMAFTQPFIPAEEGSLQGRKVYFYLDNSYSMDRPSGDQITAFEEGMDYIRTLTNVYPTGTDYYLLTNDFAPFSHASQSKDQLDEVLTELQLTGVIRSSDQILDRWRNMQQLNGEGDYYFISDFQKATTNWQSPEDTLMNINLLPVETEPVGNVYIDTAYLDNPFLIGKETLELRVEIKNRAIVDRENIAVRVFLNEIQVASTTIDLKPSGSQELKFDLNTDTNRAAQGRISIEEYPATFDNELYFILDIGEKIRTSEIKGDGTSSIISNVYGNESIFNHRVFSYQNFDYNALETSDLVILNEVETLDPAFSIAINDFLQTGGNVLLIPHPQPDIESYKSIYPFLREIDTLKQEVNTPDFESPFFDQVFEENDPAVDMPWAKPVMTWPSRITPILALQNRQPFLSAPDNGLFMFSAPMRDTYTTMHRHALFVPVMYKVAASSLDNQRALYHYLDQRLLTFNLDSIESDQIYKLSRNEQEIIPVQRVANDELIMQLPAYELDAGFYNITLSNKDLRKVAFNINKAESFLESSNAAELEDQNDNSRVRIYQVSDSQSFGETLENQYVGWALWKYCLILALLFLIGEILIIRFVP